MIARLTRQPWDVRVDPTIAGVLVHWGFVVRAKICGIRCDRDLQIAVDAGADAVGFICGVTHVSEDALTPDQARKLARQTPPYVATVLVTHLDDTSEILDLAEHVSADTIQVHGLVTHETTVEVFERARGRRIVRAVHVTGADAVERASANTGLCDGLLLDSRTNDRLGGTGRTHDWSISRAIADRVAHNGTLVILAGGLNPQNVADAISAVRPFAVDVNSGVEDANGNKHAERCAEFVVRARAAGQLGAASA